ncbi:unnamed protein product [Paramecium primaurelia]|uniref:Uncharacterized protein n=1 Tax=Paramecium primaurelia TaxID=5886 RepID=A0A8S1LSN1_PARPR|nr:unnamed protein product [Paramecium primaurelia]
MFPLQVDHLVDNKQMIILSQYLSEINYLNQVQDLFYSLNIQIYSKQLNLNKFSLTIQDQKILLFNKNQINYKICHKSSSLENSEIKNYKIFLRIQKSLKQNSFNEEQSKIQLVMHRNLIELEYQIKENGKILNHHYSIKKILSQMKYKLPVYLRGKQTRAIRQRLTKSEKLKRLSDNQKNLKIFALRKFALKE